MADKPRPSDSRFASGEKGWPALRSLDAYRASYFTRDLVAGVTLAAIAIPEQMATARLGGFPAEIGFFAFLAGTLAFAVFGANRFLSCGADSTITPIFAGGLAVLAAANSADSAVLAPALAVMVGLVLVAGGTFRLGWIADLLSIPVTTGFLAGIAAHILASQLPTVLGLPSPDGTMLQRVAILAAHLNETNPFAAFIGFGVLAIIVLSERISARIPGALIGIGVAAAAVALAGLQTRGVAVLDTLSGALPTLVILDVPAALWARLVPLSLVVAMVVMVQTAATTRSFPSGPEEPPDVDRDFVGVGAGSIVAGLFGAFPVNASPPRTSIVAETGGRSQLAGLIAAVIVVALVTFGATLLRFVPHAALGGVLLFVALRIVRVRQALTIYRQSVGEFALVIATTTAIIILPIEQGATIGIALSLLHGMWSTTRARVTVFERVPDTSVWWPQSPQIRGEREPNVIVVGFASPLSFLNAYRFRADILQILQSSPQRARLMVLEATGILEIDFTAAQVLGDLIRRCRADGVAFAIARLESIRAQEAVERFGIDGLLGPGHIFRSVEEAIRALGEQRRA
jgi:SulP family sulfate permease